MMPLFDDCILTSSGGLVQINLHLPGVAPGARHLVTRPHAGIHDRIPTASRSSPGESHPWQARARSGRAPGRLDPRREALHRPEIEQLPTRTGEATSGRTGPRPRDTGRKVETRRVA